MKIKRLGIVIGVLGIGFTLSSCKTKTKIEEVNVDIEFKNISIENEGVSLLATNSYEINDSYYKDETYKDLFSKNEEHRDSINIFEDFEAIKVTSTFKDDETSLESLYIYEPKTKNKYYYECRYIKDDDEYKISYQLETYTIYEDDKYLITTDLKLNNYHFSEYKHHRVYDRYASGGAKLKTTKPIDEIDYYLDNDILELCSTDDLARYSDHTGVIYYNDDASYVYSSVSFGYELVVIREHGLTTFCSIKDRLWMSGDVFNLKVEYFKNTLIDHDFNLEEYKTYKGYDALAEIELSNQRWGFEGYNPLDKCYAPGRFFSLYNYKLLRSRRDIPLDYKLSYKNNILRKFIKIE